MSSLEIFLLFALIFSIVCDSIVVDRHYKRYKKLEAEIKSLKQVNGFLFCSLMGHIENSDISKGDKNDTNIS